MAEVGNAQRDNAVPEVSFFTDTYTITSGMTVTINHGLPRAPRKVWLELQNKVAVFQYLPGDVAIPVTVNGASATGATYNATTINVYFAALPVVYDSVTANDFVAITATDWNLVVKAEV